MNGIGTSNAIRIALSRLILGGLLAAHLAPLAHAQPSVPDAIAVSGGAAVMTVHAVGAQIYECAADAAGKIGWQFREPIASLLVNGRTVGRHFAGPGWQLADGSIVVAKVAGRAPGATGDDIPWLKLDAAPGQGSGQLAAVTAVQRINTKGGTLAGACDNAGAFKAVPYESDYVFLKAGG